MNIVDSHFVDFLNGTYPHIDDEYILNGDCLQIKFPDGYYICYRFFSDRSGERGMLNVQETKIPISFHGVDLMIPIVGLEAENLGNIDFKEIADGKLNGVELNEGDRIKILLRDYFVYDAVFRKAVFETDIDTIVYTTSSKKLSVVEAEKCLANKL